MNVITTAVELLTTALEEAGVRVFAPDRAASINPPGAVIAPPTLRYDLYAGEPGTLTFLVFAVVAAGERAAEQLYEHVLEVGAVLDNLPDVSVTAAAPGSYPVGGFELPAYQITAEVAPR